MSGFPNRFPSRAAPESINSLPNYPITPDTDPATTCPVCMDPFIVNTQAKILPCKHFYHSNCIVTWLEKRNTCPMCRFELPPVEEYNEPFNWTYDRSMNMMDERRMNWAGLISPLNLNLTRDFFHRDLITTRNSESRIVYHNHIPDWMSNYSYTQLQNNVIGERMVPRTTNLIVPRVEGLD